ncbi:hypothetical protein Jab_2c14000 [Janthinobacterium sp. HH01]|uniref:hypothetical protein n=1 Tax=Janthinobacterium sp. HH01 TaxID=1198452 RepID=UPI0002AEDB05|nr:hypothetical protein [Janthinobacterium sp. HH01]ELX09334.1 hypothetical protein Jab_2c14000 [Janthinobacterium sp. HH01]
MKPLTIAGYALGCLYPASAKRQPVGTTIAQLQTSGFNTVVLGLLHIGHGPAIEPLQDLGALYFNDELIVVGNQYRGDPGWPDLIASLPNSKVNTLCASIGGAGVRDFAWLKQIYEANGNSFDGTLVQSSMREFHKQFPAISIIDLDCEETYDADSLVAFCKMLIDIGFGISFCPYTMQDFWVAALAQLEAYQPGAVRHWNLQCYEGGGGNVPAQWAAAIQAALPEFDTDGFILAGGEAGNPLALQGLLQRLDAPCVGGGFVWTLDQLVQPDTMPAYAAAIQQALGATPVAAHALPAHA